MTKWLALVLSCLALALVAAGCGGDDEEEDGGGGAATQEQPADTGAGKTAKVAMKDTKFEPKSLTVEKGTTVKWTNEDSVNHDVTKESGAGLNFESGNGDLAKGDTFEQTFDTAGKVDYVCTVHVGMTGSITVK
jgi:plastocyanin